MSDYEQPGTATAPSVGHSGILPVLAVSFLSPRADAEVLPPVQPLPLPYSCAHTAVQVAEIGALSSDSGCETLPSSLLICNTGVVTSAKLISRPRECKV